MTTPARPVLPFTVPDYVALGEDDDRTQVRYELQDGGLVLSRSPRPDHMLAAGALYRQLFEQVPEDLIVVLDIDIDLDLAPDEDPGFVRRPDMIVVRRDAVRRARESDALLTAADVVLAVEIVSPSSKRTDNVIKRGEYADAGIPFYWIIDITDPVSLVPCHLTETFGYQDPGATTGTFQTTEPFVLRIDLDRLG